MWDLTDLLQLLPKPEWKWTGLSVPTHTGDPLLILPVLIL